jgi:hypothetical protein
MLCFLLALPAFAALGHDGWKLYQHYEEKNEIKVDFSDVGYLWQTYSKGTFEMAHTEIKPETWTAFVAPVLSQTSAVVGLFPAALAMMIAFVLKLFNKGPFGDTVKVAKGQKKGSFEYRGLEEKKSRVKYKKR